MFLKTLTFLLILLTSLVAGAPKPVPDKTSPELAKRTMPATAPNWTPYLYQSLQEAEKYGMIGQNTWISDYPPALALCPLEINDIQACNDGYDDCTQERVLLEWCFNYMLQNCAVEYANAASACLFDDIAGCDTTLDALWACQAPLTAPPLPTDW